MPATTTVADRLRDELAGHHARFSPVYAGHLSDHGPMAALAQSGLGAGAAQIVAWLDRYRPRLAPLATAPAAYRQRLAAMQDDVVRLGSESLLERELPTLISGWARHAYHPLIRTAFGYAFGIREEVAAGLAYLGWLGGDPDIAAVARQQQGTGQVEKGFAAMKSCATQVLPGRQFDDCLAWVTAQPAFRQVEVCFDDPLRAYSRHGLAVFDATHDFFALHLVTGAHAFRVLYDFAGPHRDAIFALGLLAGYACVGAPGDTPPAGRSARSPGLPAGGRWLDRAGGDEHRLKIAYSAVSQAEWFDDPDYCRIALNYLSAD